MKQFEAKYGRKVYTPEEKILLLLLPYWTPQIPPMGIACIKTYLNQHGYENVTTIDANVEMELREGYDIYFDLLEAEIPENKKGNFKSIANEVWQNHMMAYINYENEKDYHELVRSLVYDVFYHSIDESLLKKLHEAIGIFYERQEEYIIQLMLKEEPSIVGISAFIGTLPASVFACRVIRKHFPHIETVIGGGAFYDQLGIGSPNLKFFEEKTKDYIDYIIIGEGENLFLKLLKGKLPEQKRVFTLSDIDNEVVDISKVRIPDIGDFDLQHYPTIGAYTSRSCPFQCKFCSDPMMWGRYRKKTPKQVVEEFTKIYKQSGYQMFILTDLLMNPLATKLSEEFIKSDVSIYWDGPMRICDEAADPEKTHLWRRGGYYRVEMGCESGSPRILELMDKRITVDQIRKALTTLADAGIKTTTYWVIGYPGETEEDFQMTLDLVEELRDVIYEAMNNAFWYYPGGPVNSNNWINNSHPLYPQKAQEMLYLQQWILDCEPSREERYRRVNRFVAHRKKLGIPDINTLQHIYEADERWKRLHKNAVPGLMEFKRGTYIDENKYIKAYKNVTNTFQHDGNWGF